MNFFALSLAAARHERTTASRGLANRASVKCYISSINSYRADINPRSCTQSGDVKGTYRDGRVVILVDKCDARGIEARGPDTSRCRHSD
jgi:hypothetical protein